ncbi:hypothetical protein [Anabaena sp. CA = ATCC 33047]|uniref:hypothetical protein n=1 Tax=Anabaena sp. (strain CA / ATCC 33047) TaxID=52271 RepID=UPI00082C3469|nr:hypothetical protein [Anabaena sp. CA = ATCC 33047]
MNNINLLSDTEIEKLLLGKWRFDTDSEKIFLEFRQDMTYEQTRIQTFLLSKPKEYITGHKFTGVWHVNESKLCLIVKNLPKSMLNLHLSVLFKVSVADIVASFISLFVCESYQVVKIDSSTFIIQDGKQSIIGTKLN